MKTFGLDGPVLRRSPIRPLADGPSVGMCAESWSGTTACWLGVSRPAIKLAAMVGGMKRSSGSRWYVSVLTAFAAVAMIWIISEAAGSRAKPPVLVTTEH